MFFALKRPLHSGRMLAVCLLPLAITAVNAQKVPHSTTTLLAAANPSAALAPVARGTITGRVLDPQGHTIANAEVALLLDGTAVATTHTDANGLYRLRQPQGSFELIAAAPGMAATRQTVQLAAGQTTELDFTLQLAQASSSVQVTASGYQIETQSAASRIPIRPLDLPQTVTTVSQDAMRDRAVTSMQEALAYIPGVSPMLGEGRRDQVSIRGMNANTDQYIDGVKDDATYYRDLSNTESIEVVEGPAAVLYGRGTSGGLINRITKKPHNAGTLAELSTIDGSYGQKRVEGDVDTLLGSPKLGLRTTGAWENSGSFRHFYELDRYAFASTLRWRPTPKQDVNLQMQRLRDERTPDRGIPSLNGRPAPVNIANFYGYALNGGSAPADYVHNAVTDETLDWKGALLGWNGHDIFRHSGYQTNFQNTFPSTVSNGKVTRSEYNSATRQENYFNQGEGWRNFSTGKIDHMFLAGIEYGHQHVRLRRSTGTAASVDLYNPAQIAPTLSTVLTNNNGFIGQTVAAYVQDELSFARHWKALVGVRFDNYRQSQHDYNTAANSIARADNAFSPRIGLLYQPDAEASYYVNWSHTFDPSGETLSLTAINTNNTANLKPEKTDNYEAGAKYLLFSGRLTANAALYRLNRTDIKVPDYAADPTGATYINAGTQRTDGFDLGFSGAVTPHWRMNGGWAWMDAYYADNPTLSSGISLQGKRAQLIPVNSGSFWQLYEWTRGFGAGLGAVAMNSRYTTSDNQVRLPGFARLDATAYYHARHWDLDAHIENLSNVRYYESAHTNNQIMPGSPVSGRVTFRLKF
jgi:catecholate siderophore receptor